MTSQWLISFSLCAAIVCQGASVSGRVALHDSRAPAVKGRKDFSGVVIWLQPVGNASAAQAPKPVRAQILQKNKSFSPHILAIPAGSSVDFPNLDPIFHNAFSNFEGKVFDVGLYPPGTSRIVRFSRPGIVRVFCNIHPKMSAIIAVLATPYFAVTGADGAFQIANVAPGEYDLHAWHERATPATLNALKRRVSVAGDDALSIPRLAISESGYLPVPHKNKYGKKYPPTADDSLYPGAKK